MRLRLYCYLFSYTTLDLRSELNPASLINPNVTSGNRCGGSPDGTGWPAPRLGRPRGLIR